MMCFWLVKNICAFNWLMYKGGMSKKGFYLTLLYCFWLVKNIRSTDLLYIKDQGQSYRFLFILDFYVIELILVCKLSYYRYLDPCLPFLWDQQTWLSNSIQKWGFLYTWAEGWFCQILNCWIFHKNTSCGWGSLNDEVLSR